MNKQLAKIESASLSIQDRGILTFWIHVQYEEGCHQGVGGVCLDDFNPDKGRREGTKAGCEVIRQLLLCLGVDDLAQAKGKIIWVLGEGEGLGFTPKGIRALRVDQAKVPEVVWEEIFEEYEVRG